MEIDAKLKPLLANLFEHSFAYFVMSDNFKYVCLELNLDEVWKSYSRVEPFTDFGEGFSKRRAEEAFMKLANALYTKDKNSFFSFICLALIKFKISKLGNFSFNKIIDNLIILNCPDNILNPFIQVIESADKTVEKLTKFKTTDTNANKKIKLFISYSHKDEYFKDKLETHLASLKRQNTIESWHDRKIIAGTVIENEVNENIYLADLILFLISSDFIASDYCYSKEVDLAIKLYKRNKIKIIPIIIRDCDWKELPFGNLLALPKDGIPIANWENEDTAFLNIIEGIKKIINETI